MIWSLVGSPVLTSRRCPSPPSKPEPTIPTGLGETLQGALEALDLERLSEQAVLDAARVAAQGAPVVEVATVGEVIGVAIGNGQDQCISASVTDQSVEVWRVPPVIAQPGELGCSAEAAARGQGKQYPH